MIRSSSTPRLMIVEMERIGGNEMDQVWRLDVTTMDQRRGGSDSLVPDLEPWAQC